MRHFTIVLSDEDAEALISFAHQERRDPPNQAAFFVIEALRGLGLLPKPNWPRPDPEPTEPDEIQP
jgi:hypothetical protein